MIRLTLLFLLLLLLYLPRLLMGEVGGEFFTALAFFAALIIGTYALARAEARRFWLVLIVMTLFPLWYVIEHSTLAAWSLIFSYELVLCTVAMRSWSLISSSSSPSQSGLLLNLKRVALWLMTVAAGGVVPMLLMQIESRFSDEEFYLAIVVVLLSLLIGTCFTLLLTLAGKTAPTPNPSPNNRGGEPRTRRNVLPSPSIGGGAGGVFLLLFMALVVPGVLIATAISDYQQSFYGNDAVLLAGISESEPIHCAMQPLPSEEDSLDQITFFERFLAEVERNPKKRAPELGMLAVVTGDESWAAQFREVLLADAEGGRYTEPANSIKYFQYHAAYRAYYYHHVKLRFPDLFSAEEQTSIRAWFAAINRRAMTIEWIDGLYGFAFNEWQVGPYANQEIGNGLIATLVAYELQDDTLRDANQRYLAVGQGGWHWRWRNTDDTYEYQRVWVDNAFFQSAIQTEEQSQASYQERQTRSFEWMLLQMLPNGSVPAYNNEHGSYAPSSTMLLGAALTGDGRYLWAAEKMLEYNLRQERHIYSQPGLLANLLLAEENITARQPDQLSCLLYGTSGLPNQKGILSPDKLIFRDGWHANSHYLLLNLRFTGWHRYKASNTISVVASGGQTLLSDKPQPQPWKWVPAGRQKFRDKRIPRSETNGLLIPQSGMSQVVHVLTGIGEAWAQDPPFYATVERFTTLPRVDSSTTRVENWRDWDHKRTLYFLHQGPIFVIDTAYGHPNAGQAALAWNTEVALEDRQNELWLAEQMRVVSTQSGQHSAQNISTEEKRLLIRGNQAGRLEHLTALLPDTWAQATYDAQPLTNNQEELLGFTMTAQTEQESLRLLHNHQPGTQVGDNLQSDGQMLLMRQQIANTQICYIGGTRITFPLAAPPTTLSLQKEGTAIPKEAWRWKNGLITLELATLPPEGCLLAE